MSALVESEYLTAEQVGNLLKVSEKTVYRWARADPTMPVLRLGGIVRFPRERWLRWLRDREQGRPRASKAMLSPFSSASDEKTGAG